MSEFCFETVLSTCRNIELLKKAKEKGYFIRCYYVLTADPMINVWRVKSRVESGGHDVPEEKIIQRYDRALELIKDLVQICDYGRYEVGDELFISFVFAERPAQVVGILEEGTNVYHRGRFRNLDTYLIMPMLINDTFEGKEIYNFNVNYLYTLRNRGTAATKLSMQDVEEILRDYSEMADFEYQGAYYVLDTTTAEKDNFDLGIEMVSFLVSVIAVAAIVVTCLFTGICTAHRTKKNQRYFAILALNGCGKREICAMLLLDAAIIFLTAGVLAGALLTVIFGTAV